MAANGLKQKHMLRRGDPSKVLYSFLLFERKRGEPYDVLRDESSVIGIDPVGRVEVHRRL